MDDLGPIRVFLEVARQSSFAGAARSLGITPASVTRAVARLEEALGQQLLLRTTRKVSTTSAGAIVAARYSALLSEFEAPRCSAFIDATSVGSPALRRLRMNVFASL